MIKVKKEGILLEPTDNEFENQGVLNPACIQDGNTIHMFYRAVREGNFSSIGYCKLDGPLKIVERLDKPLIVPETEEEKHGIEDPRIVFFEGQYYLFYSAYDGKSSLVAYATSKDLKKWKKQSIISPKITYDEAEDYFREGAMKLKEKYFFFESYYKDVVGPDVMLWEKDAFIFPKRINGKIALLHRVLPDIQIIYFNDFKELTNDFWKEYLKKLGDHVVLEPEHGYESRNIGGGAPFIETDEGWLMIYHAVQDSNKGKVYHASAALFDKDDPTKVIGHLKDPLFSPDMDYELSGDVDNVVFPSGTAVFDDRLYIYYGAADKRIAVASVSMEDLLNELTTESAVKDHKHDIKFIAGQILGKIDGKEVNLNELMSLLNGDFNYEKKLVLMAIGWLIRDGDLVCRDCEGKVRMKMKP